MVPERLVIVLFAALAGKPEHVVQEAVDDAREMEFERLKELGFRVKKMPDGNLEFNHRGQVQVVEPLPLAIRTYLANRMLTSRFPPSSK